MTSGVPWSVKGINPRAREIAKDLARRDGMTLGGWINKLIMYDLAEGEDVRPTGFLHAKSGPTVMEMPRYGQPVSPRMEAMGHPADEVSRVASALDAFSERIEAAERRSSSAINGMDHSVRGVLQRLAMADREQVQVAARFEVPFDTIKKRSSREKWHKLAEVELAPVPNDGTSTAHSGENGTANGTGTGMSADNGTAEMAPVPENGAANGTGADPVAQNGT
ncbi:MAG: Localization factor PodJS, partial [Alphaproteobacteria bacterium]